MRSMCTILIALIVMGLGFWAYTQNYQTQSALRNAEEVRDEIAELRVTLGVLRAEWAYLNRPDRLQELAELNFDGLGLLPLSPDQFGRADQVTYPSEPVIILENVIDLSGQLGASE